MESNSGNFVRNSLKYQYELALKVSQTLKSDIYLFDSSHHFDDAITEIVDGIRVLKSSDKRFAVLSKAAQISFEPAQDSAAVNSCLFGFQKDKSLVSYVPRKNKAVILLSTLHDDDAMDPDTRKPQIILDYNVTKGGVDTFNKMCAAYSVSRAPERRRFFLKNLSLSLMKEHLIFRSHLRYLPQNIDAFLKSNYSQAVEPRSETERFPKGGVCRPCALEEERSSASMKCCRCKSFTCKNHSASEVVCDNCIDNIDDDTIDNEWQVRGQDEGITKTNPFMNPISGYREHNEHKIRPLM
ncbi:hypothetical protein CBL_20373 [Carabus blaptoides fortunei]